MTWCNLYFSESCKMFRLSNKGNQSRKNHKIINQTTKIADSEVVETKVSQTLPTSETAEPQVEKVAELAKPVPPKMGDGNVRTSLDDIELYIVKMKEYLAHMQLLESRNAKLEMENNRFKEENDHLRAEMIRMGVNNHNLTANNPYIKPSTTTISDHIRKEFI